MKRIYFVLIFSILCTRLDAIETPSGYEGTYFLVSFMQNENYVQSITGLSLQLFITANAFTNVTIKAPGWPLANYFIPKDSVLKILVDPTLEMYRSEVPLPNAIEITSDFPITVTGYSSQWKTTDSYAALPVNAWGKEYVVMSAGNDQYYVPPKIPPEDSLRIATPRSSEFMVIASENNTQIEFRPRAVTEGLKQKTRYYNVTLNKGDCYLVKSYPIPRGDGDLTGTIVRSDKPIGFFSGHVRTAVPHGLQEMWDSKNHLIEMLQPVSSWGRRFVTSPLLPFTFYPHGELFKLIGFYPNTNISCQTTKGFTSYFLRDSGDFVILKNFADPALWTSDKPIQIGQYLSHSGINGDNYSFDPAMVVVPPVEQMVQRVLFFTPGNPPENPDQFRYHFLQIIASGSSLNSLTIDGRLLTDITPIMTQRILKTDYYYARLQIPVGKHEIICQNGGFTGVLIGAGDADAYAHTIGSSITNPYRSDSTSPLVKLTYDCGTISGYAYEKIDSKNFGIDYVQIVSDSTYNYAWKDIVITDTTTYVEILAQVIDVTKDAAFVIDIRDKNGNGERYRFKYNKLNISVPPEINYYDVDSRDSVCQNFILFNKGTDTIIVKSSYISSNDSRLIYTLSKKLPAKLLPGDTLKGTICFEPNSDTTALSSQLVFVYNCDLATRIPIRARIMNYGLQTLNHDFGIIRIGDTICDRIGIVNYGNSDVILDSLEFDLSEGIFIADTVGIFPKVLKVGDTIFVSICFTPDSLKDNIELLTWKNTKISNSRSYVKGTGGAPNIESVLIDWGNRRTGTQNDTTFVIKNTGNYFAWVKFRQIDLMNDDFNRNEVMGINYYLIPGDSAIVSTSYIPVTVQNSEFRASLETDWSLHKEILVTLEGNGTLPQIKSIDIDFGDVVIFTKKDTTAIFAESFGNEKLTVDSVFLYSGDIGDFSADFSSFRGIVIDSGFTIQNLFSFEPQKLGYQERIFGIINDSKPGFLRDTSFFKLIGNAIPADTFAYSTNLRNERDLIICQTDKAIYRINNNGNIPFTVNNLEIYPLGAVANWKQQPQLPLTINPTGYKELDIDVKPFAQPSAELMVVALIDSTVLDSTKLKLNVNISSIVLNTPETFTSSPGDTVSFTIDGAFKLRSEDDVEMTITGKLDEQSYLIVSQQHQLMLDDNGITTTVPCMVTQTLDGFTVKPLEKLKINRDNIIWSITLKLFTFLHDVRQPKIGITVETDKCFSTDSSEIQTEIGGVCVLNMRLIKSSNLELSVNLTPNPVTDKMTSEIAVSRDTEAQITIYDCLGKKCYYNEKIILNKGNNSRIFEFSSLTNGFYLFNISTSEINKSIIFIIL